MNFRYVGMTDAPVVLGRSDLEKVLPLWSKITWDIQADPEAVKKFGWVLSRYCCSSLREEHTFHSQVSVFIRFDQIRDMYSFSFALAQLKIKMILKGVPYNLLMVQPPADHTLGKSIILHYTVKTGEGETSMFIIYIVVTLMMIILSPLCVSSLSHTRIHIHFFLNARFFSGDLSSMMAMEPKFGAGTRERTSRDNTALGPGCWRRYPCHPSGIQAKDISCR